MTGVQTCALPIYIWVPLDIAHNYVQRKKVQGEPLNYIELAGIGHFEMINCDSVVWPHIVKELSF